MEDKADSKAKTLKVVYKNKVYSTHSVNRLSKKVALSFCHNFFKH